jgi:hypothetical protein
MSPEPLRERGERRVYGDGLNVEEHRNAPGSSALGRKLCQADDRESCLSQSVEVRKLPPDLRTRRPLALSGRPG